MTEPERFDDVALADNPENRLPCVLLLDVSGSMAGPRIDALNAGIDLYASETRADPIASKRVEVAIVTFGGNSEVSIVHPFATIDNFQVPLLAASGTTPMGKAILKAIELVEDRKKVLSRRGRRVLPPVDFPYHGRGPDGRLVGGSEAREGRG